MAAAQALFLPLYLPLDNAATDAIAAAVEQSELLELWSAELHKLLVLPHADFWRLVAKQDNPVVPFVDSYLRFAPRQLGFGRADTDTTDDVDAALEADVRRRVLQTLLRLSAAKESELGEARWRDLVYENWILDAPKLIDAAALYAFSNQPLCASVIGGVLKAQPKYAGDLREHSRLPEPTLIPSDIREEAAVGLRARSSGAPTFPFPPTGESLLAAAEALAQLSGRERPRRGARVKGGDGLPLSGAPGACGADELCEVAAWLQDALGSQHALAHAAPSELQA